MAKKVGRMRQELQLAREILRRALLFSFYGSGAALGAVNLPERATIALPSETRTTGPHGAPTTSTPAGIQPDPVPADQHCESPLTLLSTPWGRRAIRTWDNFRWRRRKRRTRTTHHTRLVARTRRAQAWAFVRQVVARAADIIHQGTEQQRCRRLDSTITNTLAFATQDGTPELARGEASHRSHASGGERS